MAPKWKNVRTALVVGAFHGKNMGNIWEIYGDLWEIYGKYMGNIWEWNVIPPFLLWCKSPGLWLEENDINPVSALSTSHVLLGGLNLSQKKMALGTKKAQENGFV
jgi:hypothetical protein